MKFTMQKGAFILAILLVRGAVGAGKTAHELDNDELWDRLVKGNIHEFKTNVASDGTRTSYVDGSAEATPRNPSDRSLPDVGDDGGLISAISYSDHSDTEEPIDGDNAMLPDDELLVLNENTPTKVAFSAEPAASREATDDEASPGAIDPDLVNDGDVMDGSGQDSLPQGDDPLLFDRELVSVLRKRPESREMLDLLEAMVGQKPSTNETNANTPESIRERLRSLLTHAKEKRQHYQTLPGIPELDELEMNPTEVEPQARPASLLADGRGVAARMSNVLLPDLNHTLATHRESLLPPKAGQRSLVIVFDATGSMLDDLQQLRDAARLIIAEITQRDSNPIFNYVFVPFRDPHVGPRLVTRNKTELLDALDKLQIVGGGDCPEAALEAIASAIEVAMPNSFVYVFTDATAKDFQLDQRVMQLVQRKQTPITFLLTGFCDGKSSPGYKVMNNIAAASNGQVYDLRKDQIEEVMLAIRAMLNINHVPLKAIDAPQGKEHEIDLNVDSTLKEFSVSVAGVKPTIEILDPQQEPYGGMRDVLNLENIRVVNVADPSPGKWNIKATANSSHSVLLSGLSEVQFKFGFSLLEPRDTVSLSHQPVLNRANYIAIEPTDPYLIEDLHSVTITSHNVGVPAVDEAVFNFTLPLVRVLETGELYRTDPFSAPRQQFKMTVNGRNSQGEPIQRLLSTAIQAIAQTPPIVTVGYSQVLELFEGDSFPLECRIESPFPVKVDWRHDGTEIAHRTFDQSNVMPYLLINVSTADAGKYTCHAKNHIGGDERTVLVRVTSLRKPTISLSPKYTVAVEHHHSVKLECVLEQADPTTVIHWTHNEQVLPDATGKVYLAWTQVDKRHTGNYTCFADINGQRITSDRSTVVVEYGPKVLTSHVTLLAEYGSEVEMECQIDALPVPDYQWFYQRLDETNLPEVFQTADRTMRFVMTPERAGLYKCEAKNGIGSGKQTVVLEGAANDAPAIIKPSDSIIYAAPGASITLNCSCELCQPLTEFIWTTERGTFESSPEKAISNMRVALDNDQSRNAVRYLLTIDDFQPHNTAHYTCIFSNQHGLDAMILELRMMAVPEVDAMLLDGETIPSGAKVPRMPGQAKSLNCDVVGLPDPTVLWLLNGEPIVTNELLQLENDNKTVIFREPFEASVQGNYECVASNPFGTVSSTLELLVGAAPEAATVARKLSAKTGENIVMECMISGTPEPTIRWEPEKAFADPSLKRQVLQVSYEKAALYRCTGENEYGKAEQTIMLETYGAPDVKGALNLALQFSTGQDVLLECYGWGIPEPTIRWTYNGAPVELGPDVKLMDQGLRIFNISFDRNGVYGCVVENEYGIVQKIHFVTVRDAPKITSALDPHITLLPNDTVRFECTGTGSPPPTASWVLNGTVILHERFLYLSYNNASTGTYSCLLESIEGTDRQNMFVNVLRPPQRVSGLNGTDALTPLKLRANDPLVLECPFENFHSLLWQLDERNLEEYFDLTDVKLKENLLIIDRLRSRHQGTYTCVVKNRAGSDRQSFVVGVLTPPVIERTYPEELSDEFGILAEDRNTEWLPDKPVQSAVEVNLLSGETLQLLCQASGSPKPSIHWNRGNDLDRVVSQTANLTIANVALHHSDLYTCVAENELGRSTQIYRLDVMTSPQFYDDPVQSIVVYVGDNVELDCEMQANPPASYQWLKEDVSLEEFGTMLEFVNIQPHDSGLYHCEAENVFGHNKKSFKVLVYQPAEITIFSSNQTLLAGNNVELDCEAIGNPMPVLSIIHRGEVLASTAELDTSTMIIDRQYRVKINLFKSLQAYSFLATRVSPYEVRFSLRQPQATRLDKGKYLCTAQNAIGFDERMVKLDVLVAPYVQTEKLKALEQTVRLLEGLPLFLFCPIDGSPKPTIGWFRNGNRLKHSTSTLFLPSVQLRDAGSYICFGENPVGKVELSFDLEVLVPPSIISSALYGEPNLSLDQPDQEEIQLLMGENVTLDCSSLGHPVPEVYWVKVDYLDERQNQLLSSREPLIELHGINGTVTYSCFVNNTAGSAQKLFHLVVQAAPSWKTGPVYDYEQRVSLHHSLDLTCETNGSPEASVKWMKDGQQLSKLDGAYFFGVNGQTLRLLAAKLTDAGNYQCVASNMLGQVSREFHVTIDVPVSWSPWGSWSECSSTCGKGTQFRSRICLLLNGSPAHGDRFNCVGENVEMKSCELLPCPVNGGWSDWTSWSNCSLECVSEYSGERSIRHRSRTCDSPPPSLGGKPCIGEEYEEQPCHVKYCPIDGGWTAWSSWTTCSEPCGFGRSIRLRSCSNPVPRHAGRTCDGAESEARTCKLQECHVDGGWSEWTPWTRCSKSCGTGIKTRKRFCNNPEPKSGGKACVGQNIEHTQCAVKRCRNDALLRTMERKKILTPLVTYDSNPPRSMKPPTASSVNDFDSEDYDERDTERDRDPTRNYQYAETQPVEYVDVPPSYLDVTITLTNMVHLSNDTTDFNFHYGNSSVFSHDGHRSCPEGFAFNASIGGCSDKDECAEGACSGWEQTCTNTVGSFECACTPGYHQVIQQTEDYDGFTSEDMQCVDVNECREKLDECSHFCENTVGSYRCFCPERYQLSRDGKTCTIKRKRNEPMRKMPRCPVGFQWEDGYCQDVDECALQKDECGESLSCINTRGGYMCVYTDCPPEYDQDIEAESCVLNCTHGRTLCPDGALRQQTISHMIVTLDHLQLQQPLAVVSIPAAQRSDEFDTMFEFRDRRQTQLFSLKAIRKTSGAVRLYTKRKLQRGKLYKLSLIAKSTRPAQRIVEYVHEFIVHVYWTD
ncbi:hemicentin-1-like [Anopheles nili]|uniref:hemicentin-1-like n=1 Tax=Anopheles nili TaxID=185578 RepID=UPI00237BB4B6|nr:hemicentin-1-like [Anopheles nili]